MLRVLTVLSILTIASSESTKSSSSSDCTPYPSDLKSLEECCNVPILFDDDVVGTCEFMCSEDKKDGKNPECPVNCLLTNNGLLRKGKFNESAFLNNYDRFGMGEPGWKNRSADSLHKCISLLDSKNLLDSYENFEKCMNENLQAHCIEGKEPVECDKVEDFMEKCQNIHPDCETWPRWIVKVPEYCCDGRPDLFTASLKSKTEGFCRKQDIISNLGQKQCRASYMLNETNIRPDGKWNFPLAQKLLTENSGSNAKWKKAIEKTIETCEKQVHDDEKAKMSNVLVDFWFYECIKGSLADFCPEYSASKKVCRRLKKYKASCPDSIPPRRVYMVNGRM